MIGQIAEGACIASKKQIRIRIVRANDAYLEGVKDGHLTSVERNPLGSTWTRYGHVSHWNFVQMDSVKFLEQHQAARFGMIFIDTIHSYKQTSMEIELSSMMTDAILCDDIQFEGNQDDKEPGGVKRAWEEWTRRNVRWEPIILNSNVGLLRKRMRIYRRSHLYR